MEPENSLIVCLGIWDTGQIHLDIEFLQCNEMKGLKVLKRRKRSNVLRFHIISTESQEADKTAGKVNGEKPITD